MTAEGPRLSALRQKLAELDEEIKEFDRSLRIDVAAFKRGLGDQRKDFWDDLEERERTFFQNLDGRIEHWRRNQQAVMVLLDAELEELQRRAADPTDAEPAITDQDVR